MSAKEKLTLELVPGEFIRIRGHVWLILDTEYREPQLYAWIIRADIDDGRIELVKLPVYWITPVEHPSMPHHAGLLPG